jgi:hypothetical protein
MAQKGLLCQGQPSAHFLYTTVCDGCVIGEITGRVSRQPLGKHVPAVMNRRATVVVLLATGFSTWSVLRTDPHVEAGSNTSTVSLRVVGGEEMEPSAWG